MSGYLSQEDFFDDYFDGLETGIDPSPDNLELVRSFLLEKWQQRAATLTPDKPSPIDLTDACKFSALFGSVVFAADIAGNWNHVFNIVDGELFDINAEASDVVGKANIHRHDAEFINSGDFSQSMQSCLGRVAAWINEFGKRYEQMLETSSRPSI
jgi:hypothetical protein